MTDSTLSRPGAEIHYHELGDGPPLGYAHGIFFSPAVEDAIGVLDWSEVARHHRVIRYAQRAHGLSSGRPEPADYRWPVLAEDLMAMADVVSPGRPVDWAGSSMGTGSLLWAASTDPGRFRRLVLMIPPTVRENRGASAKSYLGSADMVEREGKNVWLDALRRFGPPPVLAGWPAWRFDADVPEALLPAVMRGAATSDLPDDEALRRITNPVLILAWQSDPGHPVSSGELLARILPDARLRVSETLEDIRTWPRRILEFLS